MLIGGLQKTTMIDYPGLIAGIIFTKGCNFRCPYCHNPELVLGASILIKEEEVLDFLKTRINKLDGVVITGGEPTLHLDLPQFIKKIKDLGFLIKLDTNGTNPKMLKNLIDSKLIDFVAMDIKAPLEKYESVTKVKINKDDIQKSINLIIQSGLDYECRTTVLKSLLSFKDIRQIFSLLKDAKTYRLQQFIPTKTLDKSLLEEQTYTNLELEKLNKEFYDCVKIL